MNLDQTNDGQTRRWTRRDFLGSVAATAAVNALPSWARGVAISTDELMEKAAKLRESLSDEQRQTLCFDANHKLRVNVQANWKITPIKIADLKTEQQELVQVIFNGMFSEAGVPKFTKQMIDDAGSFGEYHCALFGAPDTEDFEFVMTGRHMTMRVSAKENDGVAFGGPIIYGHAASGFTEKPDHPGNVFWPQGVVANEVFSALDAEQKQKALRDKAMPEGDIKLDRAAHPGLKLADMSLAQKEIAKKLIDEFLKLYRAADAKEVRDLLQENGGLEELYLSYYKKGEDDKNADLGNDQVWDLWRLEGPGLVWHFRGAPHIHGWFNLARAPRK